MLLIFLTVITLSSLFSYSKIICTEDESNKVASLFVHSGGHTNSFNKDIYDRSKCPAEGWFEAMRDSDVKHKINGIFINIGFNKGYNFANWMNLYTPWTKVTPLLWYEFLQKKYQMSETKQNNNKRITPCGVCNDCHVTFNSSHVPINNNAGLYNILFSNET